MKNTLNRYDLFANRLCVAAVVVFAGACNGPDQLYHEPAVNAQTFPQLVDHPTASAVKTNAAALHAELAAAAAAAAARRQTLAASD